MEIKFPKNIFGKFFIKFNEYVSITDENIEQFYIIIKSFLMNSEINSEKIFNYIKKQKNEIKIKINIKILNDFNNFEKSINQKLITFCFKESTNQDIINYLENISENKNIILDNEIIKKRVIKEEDDLFISNITYNLNLLILLYTNNYFSILKESTFIKNSKKRLDEFKNKL